MSRLYESCSELQAAAFEVASASKFRKWATGFSQRAEADGSPRLLEVAADELRRANERWDLALARFQELLDATKAAWETRGEE